MAYGIDEFTQTAIYKRFKENPKIPKWIRDTPWSVVFGLTMWYALNCSYVMLNKVFLNAIPLQWTNSGAQLILGAILCGISWATGLRDVPRFTNKKKALMAFVPLGICNILVHYGAVISMGLGPVSFTQIIKASEPLFTSILSIIFLREILNIWTYLSLIPVVVGVSLASVKELEFTTAAFLFALASSIGGSVRFIIAKVALKNKEEIGENLTASNIYMVLTVVSGIMSVPIILGVESWKWASIWNEHTADMTGGDKAKYLLYALVSALSYYYYNDCSFYCLGQLNQVTHSMANAMKRVLVIVVSIIIFKNPINVLGSVGMVMAIVGAFLYSLAKQEVWKKWKKDGDHDGNDSKV